MVYFKWLDVASKSDTTTGTMMLGTTRAWCKIKKNCPQRACAMARACQTAGRSISPEALEDVLVLLDDDHGPPDVRHALLHELIRVDVDVVESQAREHAAPLACGSLPALGASDAWRPLDADAVPAAQAPDALRSLDAWRPLNADARWASWAWEPWWTSAAGGSCGAWCSR